MIGKILLKIKQNRRGWAKQIYYYLKTPLIIRKVKKGVIEVEKGSIVSFTTYGHRLKSADYVIRSIFDGDLLPQGVYLYVSEKDYSKLYQRFFIKHLIGLGYLHLEIVKDIKSYTKFVYALQQHKEKNIVICDDDIFYPNYWFRELINSRNTWGATDIISCHRGHLVKFINNEILPYSAWDKDISELQHPESLIFPTGTGGVLYPPNSISSLAIEHRLFLELAPTADDVWFWFCSLHNNSRFVLTDREVYRESDYIMFPGSQEISLYHKNVDKDANDIQIQNVYKYFKSLNSDFEKKLINKQLFRI